jgi:endonuclease/exonuclease/phosphatase family metal-dependent hydrolase
METYRASRRAAGLKSSPRPVKLEAMHRTLRRTSVAVGTLALVLLGLLQLARRSAGQPFLPSRNEARPLRVLTWNVGKIYLGDKHDSRAADHDLARIAAVVREVDPDVVALQELRDRGQLDRLLALLDGKYAGHVPDREIHDRLVAALVRQRAQASFSDLVTSTGRAVVVARLLLADNRPVNFVALHLDAFDPQLRCTQAEEILDWASRTSEPEIILAGDFNFDADFLALSEPEHPDARVYRLLTARFHDAAAGGAATTIVDRRLDYLFTRGGLRVRNVRVLDGRTGHLMDHAPVVGEFDLTGQL